MSRVVVLGGAGQVGGMVTRTLALTDEFTEVVIGEYDLRRGNALAADIGLDKVSVVKVDAGDAASIRAAIQGSQLVVNCVGPFYKTVLTVLEQVIACGINYVDVWDDVSVVDAILALDEKARQAGIQAVVGLGFSPGVTNVMAALAVEKLDRTDSIDIYHTHGGEPKEGPGVIGHRFHCMSVDCPMFLDGELKMVRFFEPDGIALREKVDFLGLEPGLDVYPYPHPEQVTIPRYVDVKRVTNKGSVLPPEYYNLTMDMCRLGLSSTEPLDVKGQMVVPHDFSIAYIIRERERILEEVDFGPQCGASIVSVRGTQDGKPHAYHFKAYSEGGKHSGLGVSTGVPAAAGAVLLQRGKIQGSGILFPEGCVDPRDFFPLWVELTKRATGRAKPMDNLVEVVDADGNVTLSDVLDIL